MMERPQPAKVIPVSTTMVINSSSSLWEQQQEIRQCQQMLQPGQPPQQQLQQQRVQKPHDCALPSERKHTHQPSNITVKVVENPHLQQQVFRERCTAIITAAATSSSGSMIINAGKNTTSPAHGSTFTSTRTALTVQKRKDNDGPMIITNKTTLKPPSSSPTSNKTVIQVMCELPVSVDGSDQESISQPAPFKNVILNTIKQVSDTSATKTQLVPVLVNTCPKSPNSFGEDSNKISKNIHKVGRPRKAEVEQLKVEGECSTSILKCLVCKRVFPRIKSLEAHMRIHTGEKPYQCDFPHCDRSFNQGGQLRTHHRLHTGEKPFKCSAEFCSIRFAHANRSCPQHPSAVLKRFPIELIETDVDAFPNKDAVARWLFRYGRDHKIEVNILRYDNSSVKAEVMAEIVKFHPEESFAVKRPASDKGGENEKHGKAQKISGKTNEMQGALALIELARN